MTPTVKELGAELSLQALERENPDKWLGRAILHHRAGKYRKATATAAIAQALYLRIGTQEEIVIAGEPDLSACDACGGDIRQERSGVWVHVNADNEASHTVLTSWRSRHPGKEPPP